MLFTNVFFFFSKKDGREEMREWGSVWDTESNLDNSLLWV